MAPKPRAANYEPAQFINVDLEIGSGRKLDVLVRELSPRMIELFNGKIDALHRVHCEVREVGAGGSDADSTIRALVDTIHQLTPAARNAWDGASMRDFNIGIQAGVRGAQEPSSFEVAIATTTLAQVAALGGRVVITVYPPVARVPKPARPRVARPAGAR